MHDAWADSLAVLSTLLLGGALAHVARALARVSASRERLAESFAGGVSLAFVLLDLFVELVAGAADESHPVVRAGPEPVHTIAMLILLGAAVTFSADVYGARRAEGWGTYGVVLAPHAVYGALVGASLVEELHENARAFAVFWLAMALHLGVLERHTRARLPREHRGARRALSVAAPAVGAVVWVLAAPPPTVFHLLLALVAGATILEIFREEIPATREVRVGAFLGGVVASGVLVQARWWM
jgi:uncharacterized membrane protein YfcA